MTLEQKKQIVIDNYFKVDCNIDTTIRSAYEKGFNRGLSKAPKPQTGNWLLTFQSTVHFYEEYKCSVCGREIKTYDGLREFPYCHCGAKMENAENV